MCGCIQVAYQDCTPYMLMSDESLDDVSKRMGRDLEWHRFKPNIVVSGTKLYDEVSELKWCYTTATTNNTTSLPLIVLPLHSILLPLH